MGAGAGADFGDTLITEYAQVTKMLGNGRVETQGFDGEKRIAQIRGKMRKKVSFFSGWR